MDSVWYMLPVLMISGHNTWIEPKSSGRTLNSCTYLVHWTSKYWFMSLVFDGNKRNDQNPTEFLEKLNNYNISDFNSRKALSIIKFKCHYLKAMKWRHMLSQASPKYWKHKTLVTTFHLYLNCQAIFPEYVTLGFQNNTFLSGFYLSSYVF